MIDTLTVMTWLYGCHWALPDGPDQDGNFTAERLYGERVKVSAPSMRGLWQEIFGHVPWMAT